MRLNSVHLQNFRQHLDTRIEFAGGLTGIIGPNGSGKSTILEAIAWALYGMPAARGTRDSIRALRAGARATVRVELDFELGGHRYQVSRGLTSAELFLDGGDAPIASTITGVTELLRRRLGMSMDEFFNTYFTGQKELSVMAAMGPAERAHFLSRVLGYERLRAAQGLARERRRLVVAEWNGLRSGIPDAESVRRALQDAERRLADAERQATETAGRRAVASDGLAAVEPRWQAAQREREQLQAVLAELGVAESEELGARRDLDRIGRELTLITEAQAELASIAPQVAQLGTVIEQLRTMDALFREEGRRQTLLESARALEDDLVRLRERHDRLAGAPALEAEAANELERWREALQHAELAVDARRTEWVRDKQEAETKRQALLTQYNELRDQRDRLMAAGKDGVCPTCTRPLGAQLASVLELLDEKLETVLVDGKYYKSRLDQLDETPADLAALEDVRRQASEETTRLERRLAKCQTAVQELTQLERELTLKVERQGQVQRDLAELPPGFDAARHAALHREAERLRPLETRATRLALQMERASDVRRDHERATAQATAAALRVRELHERRETLSYDDKAFADLRGVYERAAAELRAAELGAVSAEGEKESAKRAHDLAVQTERELARALARLDVLGQERALHDELDRAYSEMRTDLNMQLRPEISEQASRFLSELTDGRYAELELDESYNAIVLEDGVPKPVISGGEEDLANLVLRLAISQMIAERAGQPFSLLILDEVFGSLDEARRHNVVELLRHLHDRFEQVILITHIDAVREGLDQVITVRYDEETGASRVVHERPDSTIELGDDAGALVEAEP